MDERSITEIFDRILGQKINVRVINFKRQFGTALIKDIVKIIKTVKKCIYITKEYKESVKFIVNDYTK